MTTDTTPPDPAAVRWAAGDVLRLSLTSPDHLSRFGVRGLMTAAHKVAAAWLAEHPPAADPGLTDADSEGGAG